MGYRSRDTKKTGYLQELRRIRRSLEEQRSFLHDQPRRVHEQRHGRVVAEAILSCKIADIDREITRVHYDIDGV